jgi:hypothetical protein
MAKFLTGSELNSALEKIIENADKQLILISPFIRLHDRFKSSLRTKLNNHELSIIIVFGKNEDDRGKSFKEEDFNFFKEFPNIQIRYEKRLHAKYYANEDSAILTSMNLYSFSQDNNIEFGVLVDAPSVLENLASRVVEMGDYLDSNAWDCFERVINQSEILFKRVPKYENVLLGLKHKYIGSTTEVDKFLGQGVSAETKSYGAKKAQSRSDAPIFTKQGANVSGGGYCIRTGSSIPFNLKQPFCEEAYRQWVKSGKQDLPERHCHFSGESSNGETSHSRPVLKKNWTKAKQLHGF